MLMFAGFTSCEAFRRTWFIPVTLRVVVAQDRIVDAKPAGIVVVKGKGCDDMSFFSSAEAGRAWQQAHGGESGSKLFTLAEAAQRGAKAFSRYTAGL